MATVEHREPCESRGSRTVLGARGGEIPPRDSTLSTYCTGFSDQLMSASRRLCCKSRKLRHNRFFAKTRNRRRLPIRVPSIALPKSPASLTREDVSPHVFARRPRLWPAEFLIFGARGLLQHYPP